MESKVEFKLGTSEVEWPVPFLDAFRDKNYAGVAFWVDIYFWRACQLPFLQHWCPLNLVYILNKFLRAGNGIPFLNIPGHSMILQIFVSVIGPSFEQSFPIPFGSGLSQFLSLTWRPSPHSVSQLVQGCQSPRPPFTSKNRERQNKGMVYVLKNGWESQKLLNWCVFYKLCTINFSLYA